MKEDKQGVITEREVKSNEFNKQLMNAIIGGERLVVVDTGNNFCIDSYFGNEMIPKNEGQWVGESLGIVFTDFILARNNKISEILEVDLLNSVGMSMRKNGIREISFGHKYSINLEMAKSNHKDEIDGVEIIENKNFYIYKIVNDGIIDYYSMFETVARLKEIVK